MNGEVVAICMALYSVSPLWNTLILPVKLVSWEFEWWWILTIIHAPYDIYFPVVYSIRNSKCLPTSVWIIYDFVKSSQIGVEMLTLISYALANTAHYHTHSKIITNK